VVKNLPAKAGDARDMGWIPGLGRSLGGENGNLLQYSSLVNPMDRGAWWAMAHGVTKSQTQLSTCAHTHTHTHTCTHVCSHTCVHTETHIHACACTHARAHAYTRVRAHTHYVPSLQLSHPDLISAQGHENYSPIFQMRTLRHRELTWTYRGRDDDNTSCG